MTDIVERLRQEGENAMRVHLSLGMHQLCTEAADEVERLQVEAGVMEMGLANQQDEIERLRVTVRDAIELLSDTDRHGEDRAHNALMRLAREK